MTDTNQKLREALQRYGKHDRNCGVNNPRFNCACNCGLEAALALPTAEQVDDINVAESFTSVTKTAAPVDEREAFEALFRERYGWDTKDFKRDSRGDYMDGSTVTAWMSWQARAALQSSAYVRDAERYRMVRRGQYWSVVNGIGDHLRGEVLDARIDAAIRARSETSTGAA